MRFAASVPGGTAGKDAFSTVPSHQRSSAPRLLPTLIATTALHMEDACTVLRERDATVRVFFAFKSGAPAQHLKRIRHAQLFRRVAGARCPPGPWRLLAARALTHTRRAAARDLQQRVEMAHGAAGG